MTEDRPEVFSEVKDLLDPLVDSRVFDGMAPDDTRLPFVGILGDISVTPALRGDARTSAWRRTFQVDFWQGFQEETSTKVEEVVNALDGAKTPAGFTIYVQAWERIPEQAAGLVHAAITCSMVRLR